MPGMASCARGPHTQVGLALSSFLSKPCLACSSVCPQQSHVKEALPPAMVTRLYNGMQRVKPTDRTLGSCRSVSREQFTAFLSQLLRGSCEEKGLMVMNMISDAEGPTKTRDVQKVHTWCPWVGDPGQRLR